MDILNNMLRYRIHSSESVSGTAKEVQTAIDRLVMEFNQVDWYHRKLQSN